MKVTLVLLFHIGTRLSVYHSPEPYPTVVACMADAVIAWREYQREGVPIAVAACGRSGSATEGR